MAIKTGGADKRAKSRAQLLGAFIVFAICVAGYAARFERSEVAVAKVIKLPIQVHNFGTITPDSKNSVAFVTTNNYSDVLIIDRVDRSCGCTSAMCNRTKVLPGQTWSINAILSAHDFPESMTSLITVHAHAGGQRVEAEYQLHGEVESLIDFPEDGEGHLGLGAWNLNQLPAQTAVTVTRGHFPLAFDELLADCDSSDVIASVEKLTINSWRVSVHINSARLIGSNGFPVTFHFLRYGTLLSETVVKQASLEILGPDTASPSSLLLVVSAGEHVRKEIAVTRRTEGFAAAIPKITSVSSDSNNAITSWQNESQQSIVTIDYRAPTQSGSDRGDIIITVSDRGQIYKIKIGYLVLIS